MIPTKKIFDYYISSYAGLKKEVWILAAVSMINRIGTMAILFLSLYLTSEMGWSKKTAGVIFACFGVGSLFGSFLGGYLSDIIGNYKVMLASLTGAGIGYLIFPFVQEFYALCILSFVVSVVSDAFRAPQYSALANYSDEKNQIRGISLLRITFNLGISIGPLIGGFLAQMYGYQYIFYIDGITCLTAAIFMFFYLPPDVARHAQILNSKQEVKSAYTDKKYILFLFLCLLSMIPFFQIISAAPLHLKELFSFTEIQLSIFFAINGFFIFVVEMPMIKFLTGKNWKYQSLLMGVFLFALAHFSMVSPNWIVAFVGYTLFISLGEIISMPFITSLTLDRTSYKNQGQYLGMNSFMYSLANAIGPATGLWVIDIYGFSTNWIITGIMSLVSGIGLYLIWSNFTTVRLDK